MTTITARLTVPISERDHHRGPLAAPITLCEYGDYECPYCGQAHVVVKQIEQILGDSLCFAFRHFPLTTVHPYAALAAEAAEVAGAHRKFWSMHDVLYENQQALAEPYLIEYAAVVGLDPKQFGQDLESHHFAPSVREQFMTGVRSGVNGTPTFFINGIRHDAPFDLQSLLSGIREA